MSIVESINTIINNFNKLKNKDFLLEKIAEIWIETLEQGNKVIFCGNGGSAADSQHLAAELMGRYKIDREPLSAMSLTVDTSALTAIGNDYGYGHIFSRQLKGVGRPGDCLVGISTSGNSQNIIEAFNIATQLNITTIAFTGETGGQMREYADICLMVPSTVTNNIQEMHIASGHIICEIVENYFYSKKKSC